MTQKYPDSTYLEMKPMLKKRWLNALKIAARINRLIKQGNILIWNGDFISETGHFYILNGDDDGMKYYELIWKESNNSMFSTLYFSTHPRIWDGQDESIEDYSKWFNDIKVIPKECIKEFRDLTRTKGKSHEIS